MTQIVGKIVDSAGFPVTGELIVTLDSPLIDTSTNPDELHVLLPHTFTITSGVLTGVDLVESQTRNITYQFSVVAIASEDAYYLSDGTEYDGPRILHTDSNWYTGTFYEAGQSQRLGVVSLDIRTPVLEFRAVVPNVASVEFASLIPTGVSRDTLPTTVRQVAELIASDADYVESLRGGPRFKGEYNASTYYQRDDAVTYAGSSWVYINADPANGQTPSLINTAYWQILAEKGEPGGTGGQDTPYDATGWNGATWAPTANAVRDVIETLAKLTDLTGFAPINNPTFTGNVNRSTIPTFGDRTSQLATTQWVGNEFATLASPTFTGNPAAPTQALSDYSNKLATTKFVQDYFNNQGGNNPLFIAYKTNDQSLSNGTNILNFNAEQVDTNAAFVPSTATFTSPISDWYEFSASVYLERTAGTQIDAAAVDIHVFSGATLLGIYRLDVAVNYTQQFLQMKGSCPIFMIASSTAQLRFDITLSGGATAQNRNTFTNYFGLTYFSAKKLIF
ncbi:hypothetical protein NIES4101_53420 [Calothrix sp. NIES-4101]|nr:hypothetical protein NIES4101_53420 [Calothrix sp. NIES-4101]